MTTTTRIAVPGVIGDRWQCVTLGNSSRLFPKGPSFGILPDAIALSRLNQNWRLRTQFELKHGKLVASQK